MSWLTVPGELWGALVALLVAGAGAVGLWWSGRRSGAGARDLEAARVRTETRARMDEEDEKITTDDPAVLAAWLRERGKR